MPLKDMPVSRSFLSLHLLPSTNEQLFPSMPFHPDNPVSPQAPKHQSLPTVGEGFGGSEPKSICPLSTLSQVSYNRNAEVAGGPTSGTFIVTVQVCCTKQLALSATHSSLFSPLFRLKTFLSMASSSFQRGDCSGLKPSVIRWLRGGCLCKQARGSFLLPLTFHAKCHGNLGGDGACCLEPITEKKFAFITFVVASNTGNHKRQTREGSSWQVPLSCVVSF